MPLNSNSEQIAVLLRHKEHSVIKYPADHQPGMAVPEGGSNCAKCEYLASNRKDCTSTYFIAWRKSMGAEKPEEIPGKITAYCSDWFQEK